jgi:hypothetical protein
MRLSADELQMAVGSLKGQRVGCGFKIGRHAPPVNPMPRTLLAARAKIRPCGGGPRRRAWTVAMRTVTGSGVVFVDGNCWLDGEKFILQLPAAACMPPMLCSITHWQPLASDLFVVSANFVRPLDGASPTRHPQVARKRHSTKH